MKFAAPLAVLALATSLDADDIPTIERKIPPPGIELSARDRDALSDKLAELKQLHARVREHACEADAGVLLKAVDFALRHGEFYNEKEIPRAYHALELAEKRIRQLANDTSPWQRERGLVVRGYRSNIDDSAQPYGLVIPDDVDFDKPVPLYVWLHGRGDRITDLHFIHQRLTNKGRIQPPGAIVLHPFGRHCMGFKSAGEIDVLDAIEHVCSQYKIDEDRIVLMGFSMGGAGAWHIGAHYADRFVAMSPGAGFAETLRYNKLNADDFPWYEQRLWGLYDVPNYTRNLLNIPVVAYSGEDDKQIQAARVMEQAFRNHDRELPHIIGPKTGHTYHPESLQELLTRMAAAVERGRDPWPKKVTAQTQTLAYPGMHWVLLTGLKEHWRDARVDAELVATDHIRATTTNVTAITFYLTERASDFKVEIDGDVIERSFAIDEFGFEEARYVSLERTDRWRERTPDAHPRKDYGSTGPIDDAFTTRFTIVTPTGKSKHPSVQRWVDFELQHFIDRWRALYRGEPRVITDVDYLASFKAGTINEQYEPEDGSVIVWGDPTSNRYLAKLMSESWSPIEWEATQIRVGDATFSAEDHVPVFVYPRQEHYVVVNSGPTHREGHDRTNSLQNPKLPDWAIVDLSQQPDANVPGQVVAADFFDERWQLKPSSSD